MTAVLEPRDRRVKSALDRLQRQVLARYPAAEFEVAEGDDPEGTYLRIVVDVDDLDEVTDQDLLDILYDIQVEQGLDIYVLPEWPLERIAREFADRDR